jgi:hypothetical protein
MNDGNTTASETTSENEGAQTTGDAMSTEQAQQALEELTATQPMGENDDDGDARNTTEPEPSATNDPEDVEAQEMKTDGGKRALTSLRRENRTLQKENDTLKARVEELEAEKYVARVVKLATGRLKYPEAAIRLIDGVTKDSDDKAIIKAIDAVAKAMPDMATVEQRTVGLNVGTNVGDLISRNIPSQEAQTSENTAFFSAQLSGMGF